MLMTTQDDEMAIISELVLGYREGRFGDIIRVIANMKIKAMDYEANLKVKMLFEACDEISQLVEDIRSDYKNDLEQSE